ncbi:hypothetical protein O6H91_04G138700 [Diphasiastrum complanatum]|uniref:Uncharacterized protein n=3 Tax=Diphasiastrum complanatum TaxID=34168 RepID=A0ACC2E2H6_DIPCM|nr:hypothetical protein O6H91_04G138700 [Diphasiastrum complanatum]KAJ7560646.1 hypothetical protein O6H91_04G138700 [Diphasiastrum complanatum]KAJ7560647.1 hypothetical protein O6H91_04G138700 [Diphasiastrum complanatum]
MVGREILSVAMSMGVQGQSLARLLQFSVLPIAKVLVMCSLGLLMATSWINILSPSVRKQLSKLVFSLFLPCMIFTNLGAAVTLENLLKWWFIPVNIVIACILGCLLGFIVALVIKPPAQFFNLTIVMIGIGNIGNIPLVLIGAVCGDQPNPFGSVSSCNNQGVAYISFGQWVGAVIVYTLVFKMLAPPKSSSEDFQEDPPVVKVYIRHSSSESVPLLQSPPDENEAQNSVDLQNYTDQIFKVLKHLMSWAEKCHIQQLLQPPVAASLLAIGIGAAPPLKRLFFQDNSVFYFVTDSLNIMGAAMVPCIMLVLGGSLVKGPGTSELGLRTTVAITFVRLCLSPLIGLGVVLMADKLKLLPPNDKMFRFVLLLQHSMPSSILAGAVASLQGHAEREASAILFWEHIFSVVSIAGWLVLYLNVLS